MHDNDKNESVADLRELSDDFAPRTFTYSFDELNVTEQALGRDMGYEGGQIPEPFAEILREITAQADAFVKPVAGYRIMPPESLKIEKKGFHVGDTYFDSGPIIATSLRKAEALALFVVTVGPALDELSARFFAEPDPLKGFFVDTIGSEAVECAADHLENDIEKEAQRHGWKITQRYSPGYCGWNVGEQHKLFSFLPEAFCGITLTESALMKPVKSVSGVIGLGEAATRDAYRCKICTMENCFRRVED